MREPIYPHYKEAIAIAEGHVQEILRRFPPNKPLHEISVSDLMDATSAIVTNHPDFEVTPNLGVIARRGQQRLYRNYELGYQLYLKRVVSKLRAARALPKKQVELFETAFGKMFYNPPITALEEQHSALKKLVDVLGAKKVEELLKRTKEIWHNTEEEYYELAKRDSNTARHKLGDMFANPSLKPQKLEPKKGENHLETFNRHLVQMIEVATQEDDKLYSE